MKSLTHSDKSKRSLSGSRAGPRDGGLRHAMESCYSLELCAIGFPFKWRHCGCGCRNMSWYSKRPFEHVRRRPGVPTHLVRPLCCCSCCRSLVRISEPWGEGGHCSNTNITRDGIAQRQQCSQQINRQKPRPNTLAVDSPGFTIRRHHPDTCQAHQDQCVRRGPSISCLEGIQPSHASRW
ncbi:uncharacterized protein B0T23DRAFT_237810 [Neurospora hispaniola]|uniref:Uncharacterized protein n=1 Tax=Neurospora hispaniola TaxID=588809 RepID=A0AAJ0HZS5_9PEZI|nr:hypothetical protein B0T23DRAFT_237810 [Neurospora hispaniola]